MNKATQKIIGENLRIIRVCYHLKQHEMAAILGVSRPFYTQFELGSRPQDAEALFNICNYFGIDMAALFEPDSHKMIGVIAAARKFDKAYNELRGIYDKLSPYSKGKLIERAQVLLEDEERKTEKHKAFIAAPFK